MKKIIIVFLSLLSFSHQSFSLETTIKKNIREQQIFVIDNDKIHEIRVTNRYPVPVGFSIHINKTFLKNGKPISSDRVKLYCVNVLYVEPGQTATCILPKFWYALMNIDAKDFKNGAEIVYTSPIDG